MMMPKNNINDITTQFRKESSPTKNSALNNLTNLSFIFFMTYSSLFILHFFALPLSARHCAHGYYAQAPLR